MLGCTGGFRFGGLGVCDPQGCRGCRGTAPLYAALCALGGWLAHRANNRLGAALQMRTPQREAEKVCRECYPGTPRRSPRRVLAEQRRGCATQAAQTGATCPDGWRRPREAAGPPPYGGQRRPSTYGATERAARHRGQAAPQGHRRRRLRPGGGAWCVLRLARAQPPPWRRSGKRAALAPTRAPPLWSERSERNRRGAQPRGWEGVGPQAVGCGLLLPGSRGHPFPVPVDA